MTKDMTDAEIEARSFAHEVKEQQRHLRAEALENMVDQAKAIADRALVPPERMTQVVLDLTARLLALIEPDVEVVSYDDARREYVEKLKAARDDPNRGVYGGDLGHIHLHGCPEPLAEMDECTRLQAERERAGNEYRRSDERLFEAINKAQDEQRRYTRAELGEMAKKAVADADRADVEQRRVHAEVFGYSLDVLDPLHAKAAPAAVPVHAWDWAGKRYLMLPGGRWEESLDRLTAEEKQHAAEAALAAEQPERLRTLMDAVVALRDRCMEMRVVQSDIPRPFGLFGCQVRVQQTSPDGGATFDQWLVIRVPLR